VNVHATFPANFIEATDMVRQIQRLKIYGLLIQVDIQSRHGYR